MKLGEQKLSEEPKPQKVAIIMPVYNSGPHLKAALDSILDYTEYEPYRLIIVCSESTDGTMELCDEYAETFEHITTYHTKREGITKAINYGIKMTHPDEDIYLTQDDVILPNLYGKGRDWLKLLVMNSKMENVGLVTTLAAGGVDTMGCFIKDFTWVGTWSLYIPRSTIETIGVFDEGFSPGPGDDVDYTYRVQKAGLLIYEAPIWMDHHRLTENFNDQGKLAEKAMRFFRKKHRIDIPNPAHWLQAQRFGEVTNGFEEVITITEKGLFLDYGCGGGKDSYALNKRGLKCDGCDIVEENVIVAKHNHEKKGIKSDIYPIELSDEIPKPDNYYDGIVSNGVLHHIPQAHLVLREFKRILKPKGVAYIMLYSEHLWEYHREEITRLKVLNPNTTLENVFGQITDNCPYSRYYTEEQGNKFFEDGGFKVLESKLYKDKLFRIFKIQNE